MAANRPFMNQSIEELQQLYENSKDDRKTLNKISRELAHRTTKKSKLLRKHVREAVANIEQLNSSGQSEEKSHQQETRDSAIAFSCQSCRTKIKLYSDAKSGSYRCPTCKTKFVVSYLQGRLEILFVDNSNSSKSENREKEITFDEALEILNSQRGDSLDMIKINRMRLIQQYHPDKVASLGPKLRDLAAKEAQKINYAFQLVKKHISS